MGTVPYASPLRRPPAPPRGLPRAWPIAAAIAAAAVGGALFYARSSAGVVLYRLLTDGLIALAWVASAAGTGAFVLRWLLRPGHDYSAPGKRQVEKARTPAAGAAGAAMDADHPSDGVLHFTTSAALGLGLIGLAVLGLGLAGWLNQITGITILLPGFAMGVLKVRAHYLERSKTPSPAVDPWQWLWLAAAPFVAVALIGTMVPPGLIWNPEEPHGYDVVEYHLQVPREWYEAGRIVPLKHNVFSYFPMGVEVHYLLAMHLDRGPWEGMYLAQLMHLALIVLAVLGACGIASQFGPNRGSAAVAGVALATIPWFSQLGAIAYNEGGLLLFGTLAVGWSMRGLSAQANARTRLGRFALAGAMAGFACGAKLTAVPELLLGVPVACILAAVCRQRGGSAVRSGSGPPVATLRNCSVFVIVGMLAFLPWLARNFAWAGNPVFPEAASILGKAHWNDTQVERWQRANHLPGPAERGAVGRLRAFRDQVLVDWRFGYLLLPLGALSLVLSARAPWAGNSRGSTFSDSSPSPGAPGEGESYSTAKIEGHVRTRLRDPAVLVPAFMLLFLTVFWIGFTHLQGRFYLLAAPLAAMLIARVDWGRWLPLVAALVIVAAVAGWLSLNRRFIAIVWRASPDQRSSLVDALGRDSLEWFTPAELESLPKTPEELTRDPARLALVGESRAFYYQVPMSRLSYRTIFDLDTKHLVPAPDGPDLIAAWLGRSPGSAPAPGEWVLIDGPELQRFSKTYFDVPPPPPDWARRTELLVVKPER